MRVQFIFPPYTHKKFEEDISIVSRRFGIFPPLGLAFAAAILEAQGHCVDIIDARASNLSKEQTLQRIKYFQPKLLGFMLTFYMFHDTLVWIKFFKEKTNIPIIVGNVLMEFFPQDVMAYPEIDYGIIGSAQKNLPLLIEFLENNKNIENISGLCYRKDGQVIINKPKELFEDFQTLPFPARHLLPNHKYHAVMSKRKNLTIMVTTRGCAASCNFCHIKDIKYSARSAQMVVDEMQECYEKFNVREIEIFDPTFNMDKRRVMDICQGIVDRKLDIDWACRARIDCMNPEMLKIMCQAGCKRILYGIESGDENILKKIKKGINLSQIRDTIKATQDLGIKALGFFLLGSPGDSLKTINKTVKFAKELKLDYAQFHKTIAKPGTELYDQVKNYTGRDLWREYILGKYPESRLPTPWTDLSAQTIEQCTYQAYRKFYFRIGYLWQTLRGIKSFHEFKRYLASFFGLIFEKRDY
ncbi:MAG: radical SAM protein [Candidatus Omnitrophota bacterium]